MNRNWNRLLAAVALTCAAAIGVAQSVPPRPANWGERKPIAFQDFKDQFAQPDMIYAPFMFWFWDEPLSADKMAAMARKLTEQGFNPGYAHPRHTAPGIAPDNPLPKEEWLSDLWFESFGRALKEAEKAGAYLGFVDEYWWPSFQAAGRVLEQHPELKAVSLDWETDDLNPGATVEVPASFFVVAARLANVDRVEGANAQGVLHGAAGDQKHQETTIQSATLKVIGQGEPFTWTAPAEGAWRVYRFTRYDHDIVNYLDSRLPAAFIPIALEPYADRFPGEFGKGIPGDFVDNEGDYGHRLAWSETLDQYYREKWGRDIRSWMPLLLDRDAEGQFAVARFNWYDAVSDLYAQTMGSASDWLAERGAYAISNLWEESLQWQASRVGDLFKLTRAYTMPGNDCLQRKAVQPHDFKEVESVAEFEGRRFMSEVLGAGGWDHFSPTFIKQSANAVVTWGVGHVVPHGVFTNRNLDNARWTPDWYDVNPMYPDLHLWTDFVRRASFVNSHAQVVPDVLLVNPMDSVWVEADPFVFDAANKGALQQTNKDFGERVGEINKVYSQAIDELTAARIQFLAADRHYLRQMMVDGPALRRGAFAFKAVVLPPLTVLPTDVMRKLVVFAQNGGPVYALGSLPTGSTEAGMNDPAMMGLIETLQAQPGFRMVAGGLTEVLDQGAPGLASRVRIDEGVFPLLQRHMRLDGRDLFWLANNTEEHQAARLTIAGVHGAASIWDCESGAILPLASTDTAEASQVSVAFKPLEAYWLVFDPQAPAKGGDKPSPAAPQVLQALDGPWQVSIQPEAQPVLQHPVEIPDVFTQGSEQALKDWSDWGLAPAFSGRVDYTQTLEFDKTGKGPVLLDLGTVNVCAEVWLNGKLVGTRLWGPYVYDLTDALKAGANELTVRVANRADNNYGKPYPSGLMGPVRLVTGSFGPGQSWLAAAQ